MALTKWQPYTVRQNLNRRDRLGELKRLVMMFDITCAMARAEIGNAKRFLEMRASELENSAAELAGEMFSMKEISNLEQVRCLVNDEVR